MADEFFGKGLPHNLNTVIGRLTGAKNTPPSVKTLKVDGLSTAKSRLADQISLSTESSQALETLKNLDEQLTRYLDALKGKRSISGIIRELDREAGFKNFVSASFQKNELNLTQSTFTKETTSIAADITEEGTLDLILTNTRDTLSRTNFSLSTQSGSFAFGTS